MFSEERKLQILDYLREKKTASVPELSQRFYIGEASIRRDLEKLAREGVVRRTYGGAVYIDGPAAEVPVSVREREQTRAKEGIAQRAAELVRNGDILFLDSSTSAYAMIPFLARYQDLIIVTNGVKTAAKLGQSLRAMVYCTGGRLRESSMSLVGVGAADGIRNFSVRKAFLSCRGVDALGLMDSSEEEAGLRRELLPRAAESYALCDASKFGQNTLYRVCAWRELTGLITDSEPPEDIRHALAAAGTAVFLAEPGEAG